MHGFGIGTYLTNKDRIVHLHNLVASHHASPFSRTVTDDILDPDGVLTDNELNADTEERATQVVVGNLPFTRRDIDGMRIELCQDLGHGLLHEIIDVNRIHILVIDDVEQIVQLVTTRIDDTQPIA